MDIAAVLLWMFTVGAGVYLLAAGKPARSSAERAAAPESVGAARSAGVPAAAVAAYAAGAKVPPITHTRITTRPGEHPLLEFMHPALGLAGLACSIAFVITHAVPFAWAALGVVIATIAAGLTWYTVNARAATRGAAGPASTNGRERANGPGKVKDRESPDAPGDPGHPGAPEDPGAPGAEAGPSARRYPSRRLLVHGSGAAVTFVLVIVTALIAHHS